MQEFAMRTFNSAPWAQESLPREGTELERLELPGWIASVCGCAKVQVF